MLEIQQCETSECTKKELYLYFVLEYLEYARLETTYTEYARNKTTHK